MSRIVTPELLNDELQAVVRAGSYASKDDALQHALEVLLTANRELSLNTAIELYRRGKITLLRASEIAQVDLEAFKAALLERKIPISIDEPAADIRAGAELIHHLRSTR
jgi:predicted HTH domain antitoxin